MVVAVACVASHKTGCPIDDWRLAIGTVVTGREGDDTAGAREHLLWIGPLRRGALEVSHFTVLLFGQPMFEAECGLRRSGCGDAAIVEAQFQRPLPKGLLHRGADCAMWN